MTSEIRAETMGAMRPGTAASAMKALSVLAPVLTVAAVLAPVSAHAQVPVNVPQPSREEVTLPAPAQAPDAGRVRIDSSEALQRTNCPLENSDLRLNVSEVRFTAPGGAALAPELARLLANVGGAGADQPVKVVCDIRDRANALLRARRYVASVQVPSQRIEDGVLRLEVVSARIVEMRVKGDPGAYEKLMAERIEQLKRLDPLNEAEAEAILLKTGDVPGLDVRLSLRPALSAPGDVIGEMTVDFQRVSVIGNVQNYNSRQLGRETAYVRGEIYGLTGASDVTHVGLSSTLDFKEQHIAQIGHVMGLTGSGTTLAGNLTYALSEPDLDMLRLRTRSLIAGLELAQPLWRKLDSSGRIVAGIDHIRQTTNVGLGDNKAPLNRDRITTVFLRAEGNHRWRRADGSELVRLTGSAEVRKGIDLFGSTPPGGVSQQGYSPSRFEGDSRATVIRGNLDAALTLGEIFEIQGGILGQWSDKPLLNYDEFSIGNLTIGRGYDPGANSGDRAIGGSVDLIAKVLRKEKIGADLYGFYDMARLWNLDRNSTEDNRLLKSVGGGVRLTLPGSLVLDVTYAHPLEKALSFDQGRPSDRLLLSLTMQLVPFGGLF